MVIGWAEIRRLAAQAECDPRTLKRALEGKCIAGIIMRRIQRVLAAEGLQGLLPVPEVTK